MLSRQTESSSWKEYFTPYDSDTYYLYMDTDSSFCSIHQALDGTQGKAAVVANGNQIDAGACLAISLEAKKKGIKRGMSLMKAKRHCNDLLVYPSTLPLYEMFADLFDELLHYIVNPSDCFRASNDEVVIKVKKGSYSYWANFKQLSSALLKTLSEVSKRDIHLRITKDQRLWIEGLEGFNQCMFALAYVIRDAAFTLLGIPVSIAIAPSISLSKSLIDLAKPLKIGKKKYRVKHFGIAFPQNQRDAVTALRGII